MMDAKPIPTNAQLIARLEAQNARIRAILADSPRIDAQLAKLKADCDALIAQADAARRKFRC